MKGRNAEGYPGPTAARAIKAADRPPENIVNFRFGGDYAYRRLQRKE